MNIVYLVWWGIHWEPDIDSAYSSRESAEKRKDALLTEYGPESSKYYDWRIQEIKVNTL